MRVFPPGVRVGLAPLVGLSPAKTFSGFETEDHGVKVLITELPAAAFGEVETAFKTRPVPGAAKPESIDTAAGKAYYTIEAAKDVAGTIKRYSMILSGGSFSGFVAAQIPENASKIYTDEAVRRMFASRGDPHRSAGRGTACAAAVQGHRTRLVQERPHAGAGCCRPALRRRRERPRLDATSFMVIGTVASAPGAPEDRDRFAREAAGTIPGLRDGHITMSEPIRIDGSPGYETRIDANSGKAATPVSVVQWLRFGSGNATHADHRKLAARRLAEVVSALPRGARRHPAALILFRRRRLGAALGDGDQRRPQHPLADGVAGLHHLHDGA